MLQERHGGTPQTNSPRCARGARRGRRRGRAGHEVTAQIIAMASASEFPGVKRPKYAREVPINMHQAVRLHDVPRLKELVGAGAPLTEVDGKGRTPMHLAVVAGPEPIVHEMVTTLLAAEDEDDRMEAICARADDGFTPLHVLAVCGSHKTMEVLLNSVDEEILDDVLELRTHLKGELWNGNWGKKLADGTIDELDVENFTLLHLAVDRLDPGEDDDDDEAAGGSGAISDAEKAEAVAMMRLLLKRGADVNAGDANGRTPIQQAVGAGLTDLVELLLEAGADPTIGSKAIGVANNVMHQAVTRGDEAMVKLLIRAAPHLDVDAKGQNGLTPLCLAARTNKVACAEVLVAAGADPTIVSSFGKSALDIARTNNRTAILKLFGEPSE